MSKIDRKFFEEYKRPVHMHSLILRSVESFEQSPSKIYNDFCINDENGTGNCKIEFIRTDTVSAIFNQASEDKKLAALNFASFVEPGGGCLRGANAQEENLCYESNLYYVLAQLEDYYNENNADTNDEVYYNKAVYSPNVTFARKINYGRMANYDEPLLNEVKADIITCAAPFTKYALSLGRSYDECVNAMDERIKMVLDIAKDNNIDTLILGAWGCGVFGNDPKVVASLFKKHLNSGNYNFKVIFAIPDMFKYQVFKNIIMK